MKNILQHTSSRWRYDGWAIRTIRRDGSLGKPWKGTLCTTRQEARELRSELVPDLFERTRVCKVCVSLEPVDA